MTNFPHFQFSGGVLYCGDSLSVLRELPDESVNCCVTSPPYWGLRDYGVEGQLGLEKTPEEYIAKMVDVFREVRRVLRDDGTLWLNLGDSYNSVGHKKPHSGFGTTGLAGGKAQEHAPLKRENTAPGLKHKDLVGIPWLLAFALRADGWYLRQDIIWHKPNPMPESVTDRCTKAHEYIFLMSKSGRYFYDAEAVKEPWVSGRDDMRKHGVRTGAAYILQGSTMDNSDKGNRKAERNKHNYQGGRNKRSIWTIPTKPFPEAHFATFPPALIEPCILAGCPVGGTVLDPFFGAGTTGLVAHERNRKWVGIELSRKYVGLSMRRLLGTLPPRSKRKNTK